MKTLSKLTAGFLLFISLGVAHADYACNVAYVNYAGSSGNYGYIYARFYSGSACTGSFLSSRFMCTKGATNSNCPTSLYQYSERGILAMYQSLVDATKGDIRITNATTICNGGSFACWAYPNLWSN